MEVDRVRHHGLVRERDLDLLSLADVDHGSGCGVAERPGPVTDPRRDRTTRSPIARWTCATGPAAAAGSAAGNAACRIAIASAFAGAMPAKLGLGRVPALAAAEASAAITGAEDLAPAAFAEAAAL
jgi:hypothetical protein